MAEVPRWSELVALMQSRQIRSARGSYRFVEGDSAPKRERGKVLTCDFAYRAPGHWRVEHDGQLFRISDGERTLIWRDMDVPHQSPDHPNWAQLVPGPQGSELNLGYRRPEAIVHRWETDRWQWALMLAPPGLPEDQLEKVIASIREA